MLSLSSLNFPTPSVPFLLTENTCGAGCFESCYCTSRDKDTQISNQSFHPLFRCAAMWGNSRALACGWLAMQGEQ